MNKPPKKEVTFVDTKVHTLILRSRSGSYVNVRSLIFIIQDEEQLLILLLKFGQITSLLNKRLQHSSARLINRVAALH